MDQLPEFDQYAGTYEKAHKYSTRAAGFEVSYFDEYKVKEIVRVLDSRRVRPRSILNFGCGIGKSEPYLYRFFPDASLLGVDVSPKCVAMAEQRNADLDRHKVRFMSIHSLAEVTGEYDLIFIANVFHHIEHSKHAGILRGLREKLDSGGHLFFFEHNPYNPLTLKAVRDCEFDIDASLLRSSYARRLFKAVGFSNVEVRYTLFFPHFLEALIPYERLLGWLPLGAQYYCMACK